VVGGGLDPAVHAHPLEVGDDNHHRDVRHARPLQPLGHELARPGRKVADLPRRLGTGEKGNDLKVGWFSQLSAA
jgi:hypothetical protein